MVPSGRSIRCERTVNHGSRYVSVPARFFQGLITALFRFNHHCRTSLKGLAQSEHGVALLGEHTTLEGVQPGLIARLQQSRFFRKVLEW